MDKILIELAGKKMDVSCGNTSFRGENEGYSEGVLRLKDENGKVVFIDAAKIVAVSEVSDHASKPGFIG